MAKIRTGIVVDNYKLDRFKKKLGKNDFEIAATEKFTGTTTSIILSVDPDRIPELKKLLGELQLYFKRRN